MSHPHHLSTAHPRPVMLSEVSFSAPSTNTSFPAEYPSDPLCLEGVDEGAQPDFQEVETSQYQEYLLFNQADDEEVVVERCESPTPRKMELYQERVMLQRSQNKYHSPQSQAQPTPARTMVDMMPPKANDFGRSPSPEPFRNYESMDDAQTEDSVVDYESYSAGAATDLGTRTPVDMNSSTTSAPLSSESGSRSERIHAMTARIEHLHCRHAPSPLPKGPELVVVGHAAPLHQSPHPYTHREEVDTSLEDGTMMPFGPHRRPRSPPQPMARIARHQSEPNHSVPRTEHRHLMSEGKQCLRQINESLDELRDLLPTTHDVDAATANLVDLSTNSSLVSQAKSRRRVMRINELCGKLDGLAAIAYQMKVVAEEQKKRRHHSRSQTKNHQTTEELDQFLEEISRKADSMAYVLEQLASASTSNSRQTTGSSASQASATRLHHQQQPTPQTVPMTRATYQPSETASSASSIKAAQQYTDHQSATEHRAMLSHKHTSSVMDTIEMMADTVLRLADRLDNQNVALLQTMERQQDQQDDVEMTKVVLTDLVHGTSSHASPMSQSRHRRYQGEGGSVTSKSSSYVTVNDNQNQQYQLYNEAGEEHVMVVRPDALDVDELINEQEEVRALPKDVTPSRPRVPIHYRPLYSESSAASENEEGYMQMNQSQSTAAQSERGFQTADHFRQSHIHRTQRPTNAVVSSGSTINMSAEEHVDELGEFPHATTIHSSVSRHSQHPSGHLSVPRTGAPFRRIMTPGASASRHHGGGTMTEALMSPHDESGEALHTSRVSAMATQPKLNMYNTASEQQHFSTTTGDLLRSGERGSAPGTLRSHVVPSEDSASSVASIRSHDVSRSLFYEEGQSSRPSSGNTLEGTRLSMSRSSSSSAIRSGHPYYVSSVVSAQKETREGNLSRELFSNPNKKQKSASHKEKAMRQGGDIFADPSLLGVETRLAGKRTSDDKIRAAYGLLKRENRSLKDQLDSALGHKDHWRSLAEENYSGILHGDVTAVAAGASPLH